MQKYDTSTPSENLQTAQRLRTPDVSLHLPREVADWNTASTLVAKYYGADRAVVFDDVFFAAGEVQQKAMSGFAGIMRCAYVAAELSAVIPVDVVTLTPPLEGELRKALELSSSFGANPDSLRVWLFNRAEGTLTELTQLLESSPKDAQYGALVQQYVKNPPEFQQDDFANAIRQLYSRGAIVGKTLLLPFQTRDVHAELFSTLLSTGTFVLPSSAEKAVDKVQVAKKLCEIDPSVSCHLPDPLSVPIKRDRRGESFFDSAERVIDRCEQQELYGRSYVKLDAAGVSGICNLDPSVYPDVYFSSREERVVAVESLLRQWFADVKSLPSSSVERFIDCESDRLGRREFVVSGYSLAGQFLPWSVSRNLVDTGGRFQGILASTSPELIALSASEEQQLGGLVSRIVALQGRAGYRDGYVAKDVMIERGSKTLIMNDHNDRRGGRTVVERLIALYPGEVLFDRDYKMTLRSDACGNELNEKLNSFFARNADLIPYGTPMIYYPTRGSVGPTAKERFREGSVASGTPAESAARASTVTLKVIARLPHEVSGRLNKAALDSIYENVSVRLHESIS